MNAFTFKEKEVLALVSSGLTTKEIASKLNISHENEGKQIRLIAVDTFRGPDGFSGRNRHGCKF